VSEKLLELKTGDFLKELAADTAAPGGGSVAALQGALGCALLEMVLGLTLKSAKYAQNHKKAAKLLLAVRELDAFFQSAVDADSSAFESVMKAYGLPKDTEEKKSRRTLEIQEALKGATAVPYSVLLKIREATILALEISQFFNTSTASDLGSAIAALQAGAESALLNVEVNLGSIKDEAFVEKHHTEGERLLKEIQENIETILVRVKRSI